MNTKRNVILFVLAVIAAAWIVYWPGSPKPNHISVIHTVSYSNLAVFEALRLHPDRLDRRFVPDPGQHPETLLAESRNGCAVSVTPFANALIAAQKNSSLRIIAGAGLNGISLIARTASTFSELKGKKIGTSKGDSLEVFAVELLEKNGLRPEDYELVYFNDPFEAIESIKAGRIDAVTHVEPFATALVDDHSMKRLATSENLWGTHPDAVLLTTESCLRDCRTDLQWLIQTLRESEAAINKAPEEAAKNLAKTFYDMEPEKLLRILKNQSPRIDIRNYEGFLLERYKTLLRIKYVDAPLRADAIDWSLLK